LAIRQEKIKKEAIHYADALTPLSEKEKGKQKRTILRAFIKPLLGILILAALLMGYRIIYKNSHTDRSNRADSLERSIAMLPFKNLNDTLGNQYFVDAVMEDVRDNLGKIHDLKVISRTSMEQFRESTQTASEIAQKLQVNYLV
jgi:multisubunit Na+/H+ antiporter MnhF subunit